MTSEAKREAIERYENTNVALLPGQISSFRDGFEAGYTAASRWHSIAEEGLPSEKGRYLWKCREHKEYPYEYRPYDYRVDGHIPEFFSGNYTHYQKIEGPDKEKK